MLRYLPLIVKNCWRNRRRTILTIISIGISMCLLGVMMSMYRAFYLADPSPAEAMRLITRNKVALTMPLPVSYMDRMKHVPGVREVMFYAWFGGTYKDARDPKNNFARFGIEPEKLFVIYPEISMPEDQKRDFIRERTACILGRDLANTFNFKVGDHLHLVGDIFPGDYDFIVRGIFDLPRASQLMYFNKEYVEQNLPEARRGQVPMLNVLIDDPQHGAGIAQGIDTEFHNSTAQTKTESEQQFVVGWLSLLGNVKMFLFAVSAAIMFTILLVSANTMAMSVRERVREVGVLKTLGFTPGSILGMILGEAAAISLIGGLIGFLISSLLMQGVAHSPFGGFMPPIPFIQSGILAACLFTAAAMGVISSFVPAIGASRTPIVEALRSTD